MQFPFYPSFEGFFILVELITISSHRYCHSQFYIFMAHLHSLRNLFLLAFLINAFYIPRVLAQNWVDVYTLGGTESSASAVSADGNVIVGESKTSGNLSTHAFKYIGGVKYDLGTLGGTFSTAYGVSADGGVIVGLSATAIASYHAFKYVGSVMYDLGTLGGTNSSARAVSADGNVIIGQSSTTNNLTESAFKYIGSTMYDLGSLGGVGSFASSVSADGSVIVGQSQTINNDIHAFKYVGSTMTDLGTLGGTYSYASSVSADGATIVGQSSINSSFTVHAFKYAGTTMTDLGTLGGTYSSANAVSADGNVIVGQSNTANDASTHAFKYAGTTMTDLGTLGGTYSYANAVSADGNVIVGEGETANATSHAFKYVGNTLTDLGTLGGANSYASSVSADGKVIVGSSQTANGDYHAFIYNNDSPTPVASSMVDVNNTYTALTTNSYQLNSLLNTQNTMLAVSLNSDCTVYGANNVCVGVGGRYTYINNSDTSQTAGNIQVAYRSHRAIRVGAFLDQGISSTTPSNYTVKNSQPLAGLFAIYAPTGTNIGLQVKVSGAYSSNGVNITRSTLANTEAGQGTATMKTQGAQLETAFGVAVGDSWVLSPLAGIKSTQVSRSSYAEAVGATFPISYNAVTQSATTAYAGGKVMGYVLPKVSFGVSAGVEQDLNSNMSNYSGSIYYLGAFSLNAPAIQKTRAFAGANTDYWIKKNQRISLGMYYNQQSLNTSNGVTAMLNYTIGL